MESTTDRVLVQLVATDPELHQEVVLAELEGDDYDMDAIDAMVFCVADKAPVDLKGGRPMWKPRVRVRVFSAGGWRSSLGLSPVVIGRVARASAALDFDPFPVVKAADEEGLSESDQWEPRTKPELVVVFSGRSPLTGKEVEFSSVECRWYTLENLDIAVTRAIALGLLQVEEAMVLWEPQVGVRLGSDRGIRPELYLSAEVIQAMVSCGASLDFDPYV